MHVSRFSTYTPCVRYEASWPVTPCLARRPWQRQKEEGKKGKGRPKDKDKEKDPAANPNAEVICYCCHRKGDRKRDCGTVKKDEGKKGVNAVEQTPGQPKPTQGKREGQHGSALSSWMTAPSWHRRS